MFDFAWSELALIAVVALVVIGPKDLPRVMRMLGQWTRKARAIAREFQGSVDQMMREVELDEMKRNIERATNFDLEGEIRRTVDPGGELQRSLSEPVLANPLAEPQKLIEAGAPAPAAGEPAAPAPLPPAPVERAKIEAASAEAKPAAPETERRDS